MQQKSLGKQLWRIFSPILIHVVVTFAVEMAVIMGYYMRSLPELISAMETEEAMMEYIVEMTSRVMEHSVEITALASVVALPILIWLKSRDARQEKAAGLTQNPKAPLSKYVWIVGISISFAVGLNNLLTLSNLAEYSTTYQETAEALYAPPFWVQILCLGILVPITEEYVFRGLIYRRIRQNMSVGRAIFVSAVLFGIYHGNSVQMIYGALCGVLLAYLYEQYGSMKAPILAHVLMNIAACILTDVDGFTWMFEKTTRMAVITIVCAAIGSTMFLLIRDMKQKPVEVGKMLQ